MEKSKQIVYDSLKVLLCLTGTITVFLTVVEFTYFLSVPENLRVAGGKDSWLTTSWALFVNMGLLTLFVLQHSLLASSTVKSIFNNNEVEVVYRSLYIITTSLALWILMKYWLSTPYVILWQFNLNYKPLLILYSCIHLIAWIIIYVGNICTDVTDLLGIKQIYYSLRRLPNPSIRKSSQLKRLTAHMRHPSFLAFIFIFWLYPVMTLDRLLLAIILTSYMYIAWNPDERDYHYHRIQYERKYHELNRLHYN